MPFLRSTTGKRACAVLEQGFGKVEAAPPEEEERMRADPGRDGSSSAPRRGTEQNRNNIRIRAVGKAVERANEALAAAGMPPIQEGVTNHSLRRTFGSLLYEAGASPAYVMSQMGHTSSALAL